MKTTSLLPLSLQTAYAELVDRARSAAFDEAFPDPGSFTPKTVKGRVYWYFQSSSQDGRTQRYVGPETPELIERIKQHRKERDDERQRRMLVSALLRSGLPRPADRSGAVIKALAQAGVFRLRGVLIGTLAYQTYPAMLGVRMSAAGIQTEDIDIAQFWEISVAAEDAIPPILDILRQVDPTFREVPSTEDPLHSAVYQSGDHLRVDFLSPKRGAERGALVELPALSTHAQSLRMIDYLIIDPQPAVVLHEAGIHVLVPAPERFAIHKLMLPVRRRPGEAKARKDLEQAGALLDVLADMRPHELLMAWREACQRGKRWTDALKQGLRSLPPETRDATLLAVGWTRSEVPGLDLQFGTHAPIYDPSRDVVRFQGSALGAPVQCAITGEALEDGFGAEGFSRDARLGAFFANRGTIQDLARSAYMKGPTSKESETVVTTSSVGQ